MTHARDLTTGQFKKALANIEAGRGIPAAPSRPVKPAMALSEESYRQGLRDIEAGRGVPIERKDL